MLDVPTTVVKGQKVIVQGPAAIPENSILSSALTAGSNGSKV